MKIILATNIAESSITVPDVQYVVDFCLQKEVCINTMSSLSRLGLVWASQASADQRKGRTGRVCNGFCFRLVPEHFFFQKMPKFATPELQRSPLERVVLRIKMLHEQEIDNLQYAQYQK